MILVTGASGILGSQIIRQLTKDNLKVRAVKRSTSDITWTKDINNFVEWFDSDILDIITLEKAFENITSVIHCAAVVSFDNSQDYLMHQVNIEGTKNILTLSQKYNIKKLVYISSVAALGRPTNTTLINEETKWEVSPLNSAYANSKYLAELEVWRAQEEGLSTIVLNPSVIIGPGNWNNSSLKLFNHVNQGSSLYPVGSINYVDVRDVASIAIKFLSTTVNGERFILNTGLITYKDFFSLIAKEMNKKAPSIKISPTLAIFAATMLKLVKFITGFKSTITKEAVLLSQLSILFSADKINQELSHPFIAVEDSISWTCEQLKTKISMHK
jgi:nucleoside-diphosphate-sugar epimerase